jgi:hypothetical protein
MHNPELQKMLAHVPKIPRIAVLHHYQSKRDAITANLNLSLKRRGYQTKLYNREFKRIPDVLFRYDIVITIGDSSNHPKEKFRFSIQELLDEGIVYLHIDRGYLEFETPMSNYRICVNGSQAHQYIHSVNCPSTRFDKLGIQIKPWRILDEGNVLLCPVTDRHAAMRGMQLPRMMRGTRRRLGTLTTKPVIVRTKFARGKFVDKLPEAYAVVTWASNTAIEAAIHGVPAFVLDPEFVAKPFANIDIGDLDDPFKPWGKPPEREQALYNMAYHQWHVSAIKRADFWDELIEQYL